MSVVGCCLFSCCCPSGAETGVCLSLAAVCLVVAARDLSSLSVQGSR